jgi:hypothetical protein
MARESARVGIEAAAGGKADDNPDRLALVKVIGASVCAGIQENRDRQEKI